MPSFDQPNPSKKGKPIKSPYDSDTFDEDITIQVSGLVGSATISPSGRDVALASPEGLVIIDLDSPYTPPRQLSSHGLPWLVTDIQWSPFAARDYWVVSTANHRALVWNLNLRDDSSSGAIEHSLQGHSRAITDVNFSAHHPDILATCAVDGYVHCWDLRRPRQPVLTFCDWFAGATQVKYNRQDAHILASCHDRFLHIWDERKAYVPLKSISAHTSKIYGLDWNRTNATGLVTCSLDKSIKFWDYRDENNTPERIIRTDFPVWRARHTPFGEGVLAMPQNEPGDLYMYDRRADSPNPPDGKVPPAAIFPGHGNHKVKEFLWRSRGGIGDGGRDNRDFQLVSWGGDNELRLQHLDASQLETVGYKKGQPAEKNLNLTRQGAVYKTFRAVDDCTGRERRSATMSDPRPGSGGSQYRQSALTMGMRSTSTPQHGKAGSALKGPSMKARSQHRQQDRSQAHIGWMKGVTMTKRRLVSEAPRGSDAKSLSIFGPGYPDDDKWGEPESIQEEILRVSTQLPKVKWEHIDMDSLTLNASLNGPWGVDGESIFIKVKVDIPTNYPKSKSPKFIIEKTSFMPEATHKRIEHETHELAHQFLERKQNCLDVTFSYLLGEIDLETSTTFFKNVKDLDDELDPMVDESSSEDDDIDIPAGGSASMSQELTASIELDNTLAPNNRPVIPPLPRFCGARFSNDGRLVCFFPSKEEKAKALLITPAEISRERPKDEPFFAGFGRLGHGNSPRGYGHEGTSATDDQSDTDDSETSSSSSDSESTSMHKISLWYNPRQRFRRTWSENRSVRSSGGGTGVGTGTGTGSLRRRPGAKAKNTISLHNLSDLLPAKRELAREYSIFGDGADVCEQNASVAEKYGYLHLVDIWKYLALLLRSDIPLEPLDPDQRNDSILVVARDAVARHREDLLSKNRNEPTDLSGRVKWGNHPLARGVINDLFEYFERTADIQMLAMLSCIFGDSSTEDGVAYAESHLTQPETPLPMKAPAFSLEYFPTDAHLWVLNGRSHSNSAITTPRTIHTPIHYSGSQCSEDIVWGGELVPNSYSCGETPPHRNKEYLGETEQAPSLSTSPSSRMVSRVNSALTSSFAINFPRAFTSGTAASSPPNHHKKRPSPAETILSNLAPNTSANVTWGGSTVMGDTGTARTSMSDDEYMREELVSLVPIGVQVQLEDQTIFDDDGWLSTPLLEPSRHDIYASYRYAYAEILQMWQQPLARLEIMKFNILKDGDHGAAGEASMRDSFSINDGATLNSLQQTQSQHHSGSSPILLGKKERLQSLIASGRGLDVTGMCRVHETQLEPLKYTTASAARSGGAMGTCDRCHYTQSQLQCVVCHEPIAALFIPCLSCGCPFHTDCLAEWHANGESLCPAGDECNCVEEASNGQVESWTAIMAVLRRGQQSSQAPSTQSASHRGLIGSMLPGPALSGDHQQALDGVERDWENITSNAAMSSKAQGQSKPGSAVMSAARLSLGNRLRKAGDWSRASSLRRQDDGTGGGSWRNGSR